ncbi:MAG: hypothetical protein AAFZ38_09925 [Myxococcota bacterium]
MWKKTLLGFPLGLVLTFSVGLTLVLVPPWPRPLALLIAYLGGFFVLAGFQTWVYCTPTWKPLIRFTAITLTVTIGLNVWALLGSSS